MKDGEVTELPSSASVPSQSPAQPVEQQPVLVDRDRPLPAATIAVFPREGEFSNLVPEAFPTEGRAVSFVGKPGNIRMPL